jgi:hypothetical protein
MKQTSATIMAIVSIGVIIVGCVETPTTVTQKTGRPLVKRLPSKVKGVELVGGTVRAKPGYQFVKQPNGTVIVARMGGGGLGVGGSWNCECEGPSGGEGTGECGSIVSPTGGLNCTTGKCNGTCNLVVTTEPGKFTRIIAY